MEKVLTEQAGAAPISAAEATLTLLGRHQVAALLSMDDALLPGASAWRWSTRPTPMPPWRSAT